MNISKKPSNLHAEQRRRWLAAGLSVVAVAAFTPFNARAAQRVLRIGNQKGLLSLLKNRGTLEKRLAPLGVTITWTEFTAGPVQLEALNVGSIDFGDVGEAPPIFSQAAGSPLIYAAATVPHPSMEAVLVQNASAIKTVRDLKGKKVALNKGSNVHYFLVKLLEKNGLHYNDVDIAFLAPADARAAFERGAVDAWVIWEPYLAAAEKTMSARILVDATGVVQNRQYYFSSKDYAKQNADVLKIVIEEVNKIDLWGRDHPSDLAAEYSAVLGLPKPIVDVMIKRSGFGTLPVTNAILGEQQVVADTFFNLKLIPKKINVHDAAPPWLAAGAA
ncbi:sulfonate ABC transporter substrate-binding protein [Glaciimonas soli]|uniref:Putative aliphatic sulfonates-binding protein n=1 Tax=Glaciimonas soli TaxID=2590999 RepID=A0A843YYF7_9BURK|nr:sulfonate ABC transporter substrate-binding protein [Glaciimonas soli]MQR02291.1 aliphatic sulfonate ABC transporter substrate-binding protein [Glaciimonas soli]